MKLQTRRQHAFRQKATQYVEATLALSGCTMSSRVKCLMQQYEAGLIHSAELVAKVKELYSIRDGEMPL